MNTTHTAETAAPTTTQWAPTAGRLAHHDVYGTVTVERIYSATATVTRWGKSKLDSGKLLTERGVRLDRLSAPHKLRCGCGQCGAA